MKNNIATAAFGETTEQRRAFVEHAMTASRATPQALYGAARQHLWRAGGLLQVDPSTATSLEVLKELELVVEAITGKRPSLRRLVK